MIASNKSLKLVARLWGARAINRRCQRPILAALTLAMALPATEGVSRLHETDASQAELSVDRWKLEQSMNTSLYERHEQRLRALAAISFRPLVTQAVDLPRRKPARLRHRRTDALKALARTIAVSEGIPPDLFLALVHAESSFDPRARSRVGAVGLTQLMPGTARELGVDPHDPEQNMRGGARYLRRQYERFGSWKLALAAYNAGPTRVARLGRIPNITETKNYVSKIITMASL